MARAVLLVACLLLSRAGLPVCAETPHKAKTVLSFSKELNLSTDQRAQIVRALKDLRTQLVQCQQRSASLQQGASDLLRSHAPLPQIRRKLEEIAGNEVEAKMVDISTARKIQEILTTEQFERWKAIQVKNGAPP